MSYKNEVAMCMKDFVSNCPLAFLAYEFLLLYAILLYSVIHITVCHTAVIDVVIVL